MEDLEGEQRYARYKTFYIGDIQSKFALEIGGYSGNAGLFTFVLSRND